MKKAWFVSGILFLSLGIMPGIAEGAVPNYVTTLENTNYHRSQNSLPPLVHNYAKRVLDACNRERARVGATPLYLSSALQKAAIIRAEEITRNFSGTRPDGRSCETALPEDHSAGAESIAAGLVEPELIVQGWMEDEVHRANILNPNFKDLGIGICYVPEDEYECYWVIIFTEG